jgi:hypothetical protein
VSADGLGNIYVSGRTGTLQATCDNCDGFVSKYDASGTHLWTRHVGSAQQDSSTGVSADAFGNVYVSGETYGALDGPNARFQDAFLSKYDAAGTLLWTRQFGTARDDNTTGIAEDGLGNVYITGFSVEDFIFFPDGFLSKYDATGELQWQIDVVVCAPSPGCQDQSSGVAADALGNVFITEAHFVQDHTVIPELYSTSLRTYDASGNLQWTRQDRTTPSGHHYYSGVSADDLGNVYISGTKYLHDSGGNAFVSKYDVAGTLLWTRELGSAAFSLVGTRVVADSLGNVYISGATDFGNWGFVAKYVIPEPTSWLLAALASAAVLCIATQRRKAADSSQRSRTATPLHYSTTPLLHSSTPLLHLICVGLLIGLTAPPAHAQTLEWVRPFGTPHQEGSNGVSADGLGNVYTASYGLTDQPGYYCPDGPCFDQNAKVTKFDAAGNFQWTRLFGSSVDDEAWAVSADRLGNVFLAGDGGGGFLAKFDPAGNLAWTRELETPKTDYARGVSADGLGNVYISGGRDTFLSKYDAAGNQLWIRQLPDSTNINVRGGVSADELGNVFLSGNRFVARFDASGELQWKQPIPAGNGRGVSADGLGNVYVAAYQYNAEYLSKFTQDGSLEWTRRTPWEEFTVENVYGVSADGHGHIYTTGYDRQGGTFNHFLRKYDELGNLYGARYSGGVGSYRDVSADGLGNIYVAGSSHVNYDENEFLAKYVEDPEQQPPVVLDLYEAAYQGEMVVLPFFTPEGTPPITYHDFVVNGPYDTSPVNAPMLSSAGELLWQTTTSDVLGWYYFDVTATNSFGSDTGRISLRLQIPEPATIAMLSLAMLAVGGWVRRRTSCGVTQSPPTSPRSQPLNSMMVLRAPL